LSTLSRNTHAHFGMINEKYEHAQRVIIWCLETCNYFIQSLLDGVVFASLLLAILFFLLTTALRNMLHFKRAA